MSFNSTPKELIEQNINGLLSIHDSWQRIPMDEIAKITNGFAFKSSEFNTNKDGLPLIRIRDVLKGNTSTYYSGPVPEGYLVNPEDLIVGMDGDFNTTIWCSEPALLNQRVCKIDIDEEKYSKRFFFHTLPGYLSAINANTSSVTVKHLSSRTLQETLFPLPPLAEQKIIAEKLDTLLAQVDSTKARLEQIPQILKRFRQAVLAAAMNGKLTIQWRLENNELDRINLSDIDFFWRKLRNSKKNKNQHEETLNNACSSNLPETWLNTKIGNVFDVHVGSTPRRNQPEFWNGDIPWVSSSEVAFCRIHATKEMITKKGLASTSTKIHPAGTVMLAMIGQGKTRGQVAILNIDACHNQNTAAIRVPSDFASSEFLYFYLSQRYNDNREIGAGNNQKAMNKSIVESLIFPLPPLKEQHEIVRRIEQLFAYADTIEKQVNSALTRVNSLTQSILAKAFRGELTAQWRAENPSLISGENSAAALLEKIKAERAASGGKKASRKKA